MPKSCLLGAGYCRTPMGERCREPGCDHARFYCVAKSQTKCYNTGLDQCDYCKWVDNEAMAVHRSAQIKGEPKMLNEDRIYIGGGMTLGDILDRIMHDHLRDPEPVGPTKAMKRRNKIYNKAIDDVMAILFNAGYWQYPPEVALEKIEALRK